MVRHRPGTAAQTGPCVRYQTEQNRERREDDDGRSSPLKRMLLALPGTASPFRAFFSLGLALGPDENETAPNFPDRSPECGKCSPAGLSLSACYNPHHLNTEVAYLPGNGRLLAWI